MRLSDLKDKEVINAKDCCRLGAVCDIVFDSRTGAIEALIVPVSGRLCFFGYDSEYVIPWKCICQIGQDVILVDIDPERSRQKI